jgi:hypothetical protein
VERPDLITYIVGVGFSCTRPDIAPVYQVDEIVPAPGIVGATSVVIRTVIEPCTVPIIVDAIQVRSDVGRVPRRAAILEYLSKHDDRVGTIRIVEFVPDKADRIVASKDLNLVDLGCVVSKLFLSNSSWLDPIILPSTFGYICSISITESDLGDPSTGIFTSLTDPDTMVVMIRVGLILGDEGSDSNDSTEDTDDIDHVGC